LSSTTSLSNPSATIVTTYGYDAFGNLSASTGSLTNPFQFNAREFDSETSLYYYRARQYDPALGRFLSEDEIGNDEGLDLYTYVGNSPINFRDPLGLYKLKGFPTDKAAQMSQAIDAAMAKLNANCPSCAGPDGAAIAKTIKGATFVYVPDLQGTPLRFGNEVIPVGPLCGKAGPNFKKHVIEIGGSAFGPKCCSLASTIAHEASHKAPTNYDEHQAGDLEKKCFGCEYTLPF
jgi:RHS repeat-associated protein